jgi:hypothetical protein
MGMMRIMNQFASCLTFAPKCAIMFHCAIGVMACPPVAFFHHIVALSTRRATGARSEDPCMSTQLTNSMLHHPPCDFVTYLSWFIACFHTGES